MMNKTKRLLALALAALLALTMVGCSIDLSGAEESTDTLTRAETKTDPITLPEGMDGTAKFATQLAESSMYIVFNGIAKRDTGYFSAPGGSVTISASATGEATGYRSFKINIWKKVDGGAEYVADTTIYYYTDGEPYSYTVSGLDPSASYRITISYDPYGYYIYGLMRVDGVGEMGAAPDDADSAASGEAA